ncbi:hypothetical protein [Pedobacter sp. JY14-1]|uniref:hypothetical protein n=1 Tax=Pedobacter sp. JY14-1 TaxID=3034151 RepID=UPI0023E231B4|nr:hypothetical protein [Pedobacter sp. JY14-1]
MKLAMRSVDNVSVNNPVEILTEPGYNIKIKDTYVYTYDDEGYPLTMQTPDGKSSVRNFEYTVR